MSKSKRFKIIVSLSIFVFIIFLCIPFSLLDSKNSTIVYDSNWVEIAEILNDKNVRHREVELSDIPAFYKKSVISLEDKSFSYNLWISLTWLLRSTYENISNLHILQWWSTITSQLIRNSLWLNKKRDIWIKFKEFAFAIKLTLTSNKDEIFRMYADRLYFSNLNYWIKSAAIYYFWRNPKDLTYAEQLALITIEKNASRYDPISNYDRFRSRFELLASVLQSNWVITDLEKKSILDEKLDFKRNHSDNLPYVKDFILKNWDSFMKHNLSVLKDSPAILKTTFDLWLTKKISEIWNWVISELWWRNVWDYSVVIAERNTWKLLVLIWWKNFMSKEGQVNSALALRQPWSTIKPFTYLLANKISWVKPDDSILDLPALYKTKDGYSYEPKNYSTKFEWEVPMWQALAESMNVPAVKTLESIWVQKLLDFLRRIWITSLNKDADHYWLALTLWVGEVSLFELLRAYWIFAWDWYFCDLPFIANTNKTCEHVIWKENTDVINSILQDRYLKIWGYPINSALDFSDINVFFKTWTSRNFRDNWTIWYTDNYLIWVWAWNKDASNMKWVSWATWAWEIFARIVRLLEKSSKNSAPTKINLNSKSYLEIISPLSWEVFKIDEYKPLELQKIQLWFKTNLNYSALSWFYDWKKIDSTFLKLEKGFHKLSIELTDGQSIIGKNEVTFEVRESTDQK